MVDETPFIDGKPDPSFNVIQLVQAAIRRLDDLEAEREKRLEAVLDERDKRLDDQLHHLRELISLRADQNAERLRIDSDRIDALRAGDLRNVDKAIEAFTNAALSANATADRTAQALRDQVAVSAKQAEQRLEATLAPILADVSDLRRYQFESQGSKTQVVDSRQASSTVVAYIFGAIGASVGLVSLLLTLTR